MPSYRRASNRPRSTAETKGSGFTLSTGVLALAPIEVIWKGCEPSDLEVEYVTDVVRKASLVVPDLPSHVSKIIVRPPKPLPKGSHEIMNDDELFVLGFVNGSGRYMWPSDANAVGWIEVDYMPQIDFLIALICHEMAHALDRANDTGRFQAARDAKKPMRKHPRSWSEHAVRLYQLIGCEKAALFYDGMAYKSTRKRHTDMIPSERDWLYRVWGMFDRLEFGELREEFTELFCLPKEAHDER
jgi:hypothetical protein